MKAYKKLQTRYHEKVKAKWRARIKCLVISVLIIVVVACFVGLVIGLSLGLNSSSVCADQSYERFCGHCTDIRTDPNNCGGCGNVCAFDAVCENKQCVFCTYNCSADNDFCTISPCNKTTGCSIFDCASDNNPCTIPPCNSSLGGCTPLDCSNDGNYCTVGSCSSAIGGCPLRDCDLVGNVCLTNPCRDGACSYQCPQLLLDSPLANYTATITYTSAGFKPFQASSLTVASVPWISTINVTFTPTASGTDLLNVTAPNPNIVSTYSLGSMYLHTSSAGGAKASDWETLLKSLTYTVSTSAGTYQLKFDFQVVNVVSLSLSQAGGVVSSFITLNV